MLREAINLIKDNPNKIRQTYGDNVLRGVRCVVFTETYRDFLVQIDAYSDELIGMNASQKWDASEILFPDESWIRFFCAVQAHRLKGIRCDAVYGARNPDVWMPLLSEPWSLKIHD